jgi:hypothetical protein
LKNIFHGLPQLGGGSQKKKFERSCTNTDEENGNKNEDADEDEDSDVETWKTNRPTVVPRARKKVRGREN